MTARSRPGPTRFLGWDIILGDPSYLSCPRRTFGLNKMGVLQNWL